MGKRYIKILSVFSIIFCLAFTSCSDDSSTGNELNHPIYAGDTITIVDRTGKEWDITHAVSKYGMDPERFNFGLGPEAFPLIIEPDFICEGEDGYPSPTHSERILGASVNNVDKAFSIQIMSRHEAINDRFGAYPILVGY